ncbi:N/A [soil metagenome]
MTSQSQDPTAHVPPNETPDQPPTPPRRRAKGKAPRSRSDGRDRSPAALLWYRLVQHLALLLFSISGGIRATGRRDFPSTGGALLVSNHLSFWDVLVLTLLLPRPLNFVARSTLFFPPLGGLIRSVGAFPIERDRIGSEGYKETLRRLRAGGIVTLFPEWTRSRDGSLGPLKPWVATLAVRARVPIVPAGLAGTFEAWPRHRPLPSVHPIRVHYGRPIFPEELDGLDSEAATRLIAERLQNASETARLGLLRDLGRP